MTEAARRTWFFVILAIGVSTAVAKQPPDTTIPYNIILVTPDQMRADFMHTYGYSLADTPNIDRLAEQGTVFLNAYSAGSWTTPSFATIMTGLYPTVHGMTLPPHLACGPSVDTPVFAQGQASQPPPSMHLSRNKPIFPELLKSHGVTVAADVANCWAIWDMMARGWDSLKIIPSFQLVNGKLDRYVYLTAPQTLSWADQWLTSHRQQRFFLWVHFMEPHSPYNPPRGWDLFSTPDDFPNLFDDNPADSEQLLSLAILGNHHAIRRLRELYTAKILYVDSYIGQLISEVRSLGLDQNTIVILISDHGELLFSHPKDFNTTDHRSVYAADLHVPLIFWGAGIPAGRRLKALVGQYDIAPTVLDLENLPAPPEMDGKSLRPLLAGAASQAHHYVYSEVHIIKPQYAIRDERYTLIETLRSGGIQCFDRMTDPGELTNICKQIPQKAAELKAALDLHIQSMIQQAKSYPDWKNNLAVSIVTQHDSEGLRLQSPAQLIIKPPSAGSFFQINHRSAWSISTDRRNCLGVCYWSRAGADTASVVWRTDNPLVGRYEIAVWYGGTGQPDAKLASNADFTVRFKGGTLSYPIDQSEGQGQWKVLGRFDDPISVTLTNQADGAVIADAVRFLQVSNGPRAATAEEKAKASTTSRESR